MGALTEDEVDDLFEELEERREWRQRRLVREATDPAAPEVVAEVVA